MTEKQKAPNATITDQVLAYLMTGKTLTHIQCLRLFGSYRLADIVFRLQGRAPIDMVMLTGFGRNPSTGQQVEKSWGVYSIDRKWREAQNGKTK